MPAEQPKRQNTEPKQEVKPRQPVVIEGELTDDELKQVTGGGIKIIGTGGPTRRRTPFQSSNGMNPTANLLLTGTSFMLAKQPELKTTEPKQDAKSRPPVVIEGELTDDELKQVTGGNGILTGGPTRRRTRSSRQTPT